jgi:hypothetical protein
VFDSQRELGIFLFTTASRTALGSTQPPFQWVPEALSLGEKQPGRETDHLLPSSAEVKKAWSYTSTPQYVFVAWCLVKYRDNLPLPLYGELGNTVAGYDGLVSRGRASCDIGDVSIGDISK